MTGGPLEDLKVALDTSILARAEGVYGEAKRTAALNLIKRLPHQSTVLPMHTLGELCHLLLRKARRTPSEARHAIVTWNATFPVVATTPEVMLAAVDLLPAFRLTIWEGVILAAARHAQCRLLLSENFRNGFSMDGLTVTNPFVEPKHPLLALVLLPPGAEES
jgi:predicted nucleic acid-binding protein